jgi:hypothetical protein
MRSLRFLLAATGGRLAVVALACAALGPAFGDLHVLAAGHREAPHDFSGSQLGESSPTAAACTHGGARHVEAASTVERSPCAACLQRPAPAVGAVAVAVGGALLELAEARLPAVVATESGAHLSAASRGPPAA